MDYQNLGNTSLRVSRLSLGTMLFGEEQARSTSAEIANQMLKAYYDMDGNFIDTADVYGKNGASEKIIGKWMKDYERSEIILATKLRFRKGKGQNNRGVSRKYILQAVKKNLERLQTDYIDLLYLHSSTKDMNIHETMKALNYLVDAGLVHYIGVSNWKAWQIGYSVALSESKDWSRFEAAQYQYSLVERNIEEEFSDLCVRNHISIIPWGPLGGGFLSGKYAQSQEKPPEGTRISVTPDHAEEAWKNRATDRNWKIIEVVNEIASETGATHPQIALAWLLHQEQVTSPIIGARTMDQFFDNMKTLEVNLNMDQLKRLDNVSTPHLEYPYGMIQKYASE